MSEKRIKFTYKNHRGEIAEREVEVESLVFRFDPMPDYGYQPGWFLKCRDFTNGRTGEPRDFALTHIVLPEQKEMPTSLVLKVLKFQ